MNKKAQSRLKNKQIAVKFKDDDWETPIKVLEDIEVFLEKGKTIYDPFYCDGYVKTQWKDLGFNCINNKVDAFIKVDFDFDYIITNPPFSQKKKVMELCLSYDKPFMILLPISAMGAKWIKPYFDKLQFIIPNGRYSFYKKDKKTAGAWDDTAFFCYKMNLSQLIIKLD